MHTRGRGARVAADWDKVLEVDVTAVISAQITEAQEHEALTVTVDQAVKKCEEEMENSPIGSFTFYRHTPPFQALKLEDLTSANSRRQESVSLYADIDNFTRFFADGVDDDTRLGIKGERVRCCISRSVLRSEEEQKRCAGRQTAIGPTL